MSCYLNREINVLTETDYPIADGRRAILPQRRMKTDMSNDDLDVCFKLVQDVARQAGEVIVFLSPYVFFTSSTFHGHGEIVDGR